MLIPMTRKVVKPTLERAQPVCAVSEPTLGLTEQVVTAITGLSVGLVDLETMLKRLLPAIPAQAPPPPTHLKTILKRLLPTVPAQAPPPGSAPMNRSHVEMPASRNTDTDAASPSGDIPQGLRYCVSPVAITATG